MFETGVYVGLYGFQVLANFSIETFLPFAFCKDLLLEPSRSAHHSQWPVVIWDNRREKGIDLPTMIPLHENKHHPSKQTFPKT